MARTPTVTNPDSRTVAAVMNSVITSKAKEMDLEQFVQEVVTGKLSASIYHDVKPIYPLRRVEVRKTEIEAEPGTAS